MSSRGCCLYMNRTNEEVSWLGVEMFFLFQVWRMMWTSWQRRSILFCRPPEQTIGYPVLDLTPWPTWQNMIKWTSIKIYFYNHFLVSQNIFSTHSYIWWCCYICNVCYNSWTLTIPPVLNFIWYRVNIDICLNKF